MLVGEETCKLLSQCYVPGPQDLNPYGVYHLRK